MVLRHGAQRLVAGICIVGLVVPAWAQTTKPAESPTTVIKVSSQMVLEEVSVSDAHNNPGCAWVVEAGPVQDLGRWQTTSGQDF